MREILFRAKRLDNGEWRESTTICKNERLDGGFDWYIGAREPAIQAMDELGNMVAVETLGKCLFYAIDPETVGQFTGLTDVNGKKIFEGDVLRYNGKTGYVVYGFGCFDIHDTGDSENSPAIDIVMYAHSVEVIGNIHDNPDLLKEGVE